jgi:hypothetical protein
LERPLDEPEAIFRHAIACHSAYLFQRRERFVRPKTAEPQQSIGHHAGAVDTGTAMDMDAPWVFARPERSNQFNQFRLEMVRINLRRVSPTQWRPMPTDVIGDGTLTDLARSFRFGQKCHEIGNSQHAHVG